jgi:hypothetical protein
MAKIIVVGGEGEQWPKQCMHMWINELKKSNAFRFKKKESYKT